MGLSGYDYGRDSRWGLTQGIQRAFAFTRTAKFGRHPQESTLTKVARYE